MNITIRKTSQTPFPVVISRKAFHCCAPTRILKALTPSEQADAIQKIAEKYDRKMQKAILEAFQSIKDEVKIKNLVTLIEQGASDASIFEALGVKAAKIGAVLDSIGAAAREVGVLTVTQVQQGVAGIPKVQVYFDENNPEVVEYLRARSSDLVTRISEDVRFNIRQELADMVHYGESTPAEVARRIRDSVGLTPRQKMAVDNYRRYLENGDPRAVARNVGGNAERIILAGFRDKTMSSAKIDKLVNSYRGRCLQSRAMTISQTEAFRAANAGSHYAWKQIAKDLGADGKDLRRFWVATHDDHTRHSHREIPFLNEKGVGLDEHFKSPLGLILYPGDPDADPSNSINCRCRLVVRFVNTPLGFLPPMEAGRSILPEGSR